MDKYSEDYFLNKYDNHIEFEPQDYQRLVYEYELPEETRYGEPRRWSRWAVSICKLKDRYFKVDWDQGLTEMQEDEFYDSTIEEVRPYEYEKTITVKEWRPVKNE